MCLLVTVSADKWNKSKQRMRRLSRILVKDILEMCHLSVKQDTRAFSKCDNDEWRELDVKDSQFRA